MWYCGSAVKTPWEWCLCARWSWGQRSVSAKRGNRRWAPAQADNRTATPPPAHRGHEHDTGDSSGYLPFSISKTFTSENFSAKIIIVAKTPPGGTDNVKASKCRGFDLRWLWNIDSRWRVKMSEMRIKRIIRQLFYRSFARRTLKDSIFLNKLSSTIGNLSVFFYQPKNRHFWRLLIMKIYY